MGFYEQTPSPSSPVLVLQSQHHQAYGMPSNRQSFVHEPRTLASWSRSMQQALSTSKASRKRTRDASEDFQGDSCSTYTTPNLESSGESWDCGVGTAFTKPNGLTFDASTLGKTKFVQSPVTIQDRPVLRSFKSQRLEVMPTSLTVEEFNPSNDSVFASSPPKGTAEDPTIDAFTIYLGIGWSLIGEDEHIQAAARGWAKFIENHYPLNKVRLRLQSKGLSSYLVQADEGWFLFAEDLKQGRLVSVSLEKAFKNLKTSPPIFDNNEVMAAAETPKLEAEMIQEASMNEISSCNLNRVSNTFDAHAAGLEVPADALHNLTGHELEGEMDMS